MRVSPLRNLAFVVVVGALLFDDIRGLYGTMRAAANAALATIATLGSLNGVLRPTWG